MWRRGKCPLPSLTLDIGMRQDGSLSVVEINPPAPRSGTALFVWSYGASADSLADNQVLLGEKPFEFRVLREPLSSVTGDRKQTFEHLALLGYSAEDAEELHDGKNEKCCMY